MEASGLLKICLYAGHDAPTTDGAKPKALGVARIYTLTVSMYLQSSIETYRGEEGVGIE